MVLRKCGILYFVILIDSKNPISKLTKMRGIDYLCFNVYNWFYKMSLYRPNVSPGPQTVMLLSMGASAWVMLFWMSYLRFHHSYLSKVPSSTLYIAGIYILFFGIFRYILIDKNGLQKLFWKYEEKSKQSSNGKRELIISFSILLIPYLFIFMFAFLG
jgi:hypothetical protein